MSEWIKMKPKFCPDDTVIAIEVDNTALQYGKKYKVRKENSDDTKTRLSKEFRSEGEFVYLEGISGGWYPNRFKLDTGPSEEVLSKEKVAGKSRRMLRI